MRNTSGCSVYGRLQSGRNDCPLQYGGVVLKSLKRSTLLVSMPPATVYQLNAVILGVDYVEGDGASFLTLLL